MTRAFAAVALLLAGGCATVPADPPARPPVAGDGECAAPAAQRLVGQRATQELGGEVLRLTGARSLRWGPPDSAFTMDYRPDRVNVIYDRTMIVTQISCG